MTAFFHQYPACENVQVAGDIAGCRRLLKNPEKVHFEKTCLSQIYRSNPSQ